MLRTLKKINFIIISSFIFTLCFWVLIVFVGYKLYNLDWSDGIKPVIEKTWCGSAGCFNK